MPITATHINYFHICPRKLWLFAQGINMEHTSDTVYEGKHIHETTYPQRSEKMKELELSATIADGTELRGKIDFYDPKTNVIHETKRSNKMEKAHEWQVKFYIWLLEMNDIKGAKGILEYPKLRQSTNVVLHMTDRQELDQVIQHIKRICESPVCPPVIHSGICKKCSYYDLCYIGE